MLLKSVDCLESEQNETRSLFICTDSMNQNSNQKSVPTFCMLSETKY